MIDRSEEDKQHLFNIAENIKEVQSYVGEADYPDFESDKVQMRAISHNLSEIGGAAKLLSDDFKKEFSEVDWDTFIRLQDAPLSNRYEQDPHVLWAVIKNELPVMKDYILEVTEKIEDQDDEIRERTFRGKPTDPDRQADKETPR